METSRSIADLVQEARKVTGKAVRSSDEQLVTWLEEQEITSASDFYSLSDMSVTTIAQAPGASLLLLDALKQLREKARNETVKPSVPTRQAESPPRCSDRLVDVEVQSQIGTITMCNDTKRNALSTQVCDEIRDGLMRCCAAGVRVVVLRAKPGVKVWSAGHDIRDFKRIDGSSAEKGTSKFQDPLSSEDAFVKLLQAIKDLSVPVIGCIQGTVWGAATDICACCDVLVATPDATFAITPAKIGLPYNCSGMSHFVQVIPLHVVKWMFFSGEPICAEDALTWGFLNKIVPAEHLTDKTYEMASTIASRAPLVVQLLKKQVSSMCAAPALTPHAFEELHEMRRQSWSSKDMEEGVRAFFSKRKPCFRGE